MLEKKLWTLIKRIAKVDSKNIDDGEPEVHIDRSGRLYIDISELAESPSFRRQIEIAANMDIRGDPRNSQD